MQSIEIYAAQQSPRLLYVLNWIFSEQCKLGYHVVSSPSVQTQISYGKIIPGTISIPDEGLLWQKNIQRQNIAVGNWNNLPAFFPSQEDYTITFDLFSAVFYNISRYEEYLPYKPDKHERYPAADSILTKNGLLERPITDEWLHALRSLLRDKLGLKIEEPAFSFQPTYDIDIAWSYKNKGLMRNLGAGLKDFVRFKFSLVNERIDALYGDVKDPYDAYGKMSEWHKEFGLTPYYFILAALEVSDFDKNISPVDYSMQQLVKQLYAEGKIGMHPSYFSQVRTGEFAKEKASLEEIVVEKITISRQHYLRHKLPETYRMLIQQGIEEDFTMGYGTHLGFRAGTGRSFLWFDLPQEQQTELRVHPFCFMDSTAKYDCGLSPEDTFKKLGQMAEKLKSVNSGLITVFHNFSLGTAREWKGWDIAYRQFLANITAK